jgi:hypothetical protein
MATAQARLAGRFPPGTDVRLVEVASAAALRAEGGREVDSQTVGDDGVVTFSKGVEVGRRYFVVGLVGGSPLEVRIRGNVGEDAVNGQAPISPDRVRLSDGSWSDEPPKREKAPQVPPGPRLGQHQVPKGTPQRSDTPRGTAHPVDPSDQEPLRRQEDVPQGTRQMSDTRPREVDGVTVGGGGEASELLVGPQRQEDVPKGTPQRSDTPTGVATPIPVGDSVEAWRQAESSQARESRGDWTRAHAEPLDAKGVRVGKVKGASEKKSVQRDEDLKRSEREASDAAALPDDANTSGLDAEGQPVAEDVAAAAGVESASRPAEPIRARKPNRRGGRQTS